MSYRVLYVLPDPEPARTLRLGPVDRPSMPHRGDVVLFGAEELPARVESRWLLDACGVFEIHLTPMGEVTEAQWRAAGFLPPPAPDETPAPF